MPVKKPPQKARVVPVTPIMPDYGRATTAKTVLALELLMFRQPHGSQLTRIVDGKVKVLTKNADGTPAKGKPRWYHFIRIVDMIWNYPNSPKPFDWHPDAMRMLKAACKRKRLGVAGAGSTGKSDFFALWAIVNWLSAPKSCMVLVTSTTKSAATNRIWGKVIAYWNGMIAGACGKLMTSSYSICYFDHNTGETDHTCGIKLVAGEASKAARSADEIRGIKGDPLILIGDEFAELSHSLTNTFDENLTANYNHQIIALANPDTYFDPFGEFCEPVGGWDTVGEDDYEWEAKKGAYVIRLNAELSPNILEGRLVYKYLMQLKQLEEKQINLGGRHSPAYYRGVLGMWCPTGNELTIYTQAELMLSNACKKAVWEGDWVALGGFDVAHTHDGDRSVLSVGRVGMTTGGKLTLEFVKYIEINEDTRIKDVDRTTQVVRKLKAACEENGILPENLAIDATGPGGKAFRDAVIAQWSNKFLPVDFAGAPSDKPVSRMDKTPCNKRYDRRVSEIWYAAKAFLRADQLRGISNALAAELVVRRYKETKPGSDDRKIAIETKREMKIRTQKSPDLGDSFMVLCDLARTRHKFISADKPAERKVEGVADPVKKRFRQLQNLYAA